MDEKKREELACLLTALPPVEFCCVYGSSLHPNNHDKSRMIDYILGVRDPTDWHSQNLKMNRNHYASWMVCLRGAKLITEVADEIGVGVHFNPFVSWNNKTVKYSVVRTHDLVEDILNWERFYLSGRLQKPEDLYAKICSLSYMGDLRMLFAEDRQKVQKIVQGQFDLFRRMYKPVLEEFATKDLLRFSSSSTHPEKISQDCSLPALQSLVSRLPRAVRSNMGIRLGEKPKMYSGCIVPEIVIKSRTEAANCLEKIVRRKVMVSSFRQAVYGLLTVGTSRASRYLANKMQKAWKSWV